MTVVECNQFLIPNSRNFFMTFGSFTLFYTSETILNITRQPYSSVINTFINVKSLAMLVQSMFKE